MKGKIIVWYIVVETRSESGLLVKHYWSVAAGLVIKFRAASRLYNFEHIHEEIDCIIDRINPYSITIYKYESDTIK